MIKKLILGLSVISLIIVAGCQTSTEPATQELLLPLEQLPPSWEISGAPRPMGPRIGFGDEDDFYVSFKLKSSKYIISDHFVLYYPSKRKAENGYAKLFLSEFNSNSIAVDAPWQTPSELSYTSAYADQFHMACTINNVAGPKQVCKAMAQYGKYIVIFSSSIKPNTISLSEFNDIVRFLDEMMIRELKLVQHQTSFDR